MSDREILFNAESVREAIHRIAVGIAEEFRGREPENFALLGIHKQGVPLAWRLAEEISGICGYTPDVGKLDISMYRDDIGSRCSLPLIRETDIPFDVADNNIVLVDDILSSGRTIRAALDAITDFGRPAVIRLAVLVDRHASEFPIHPDYSGINALVEKELKLVAEFAPEDPEDSVYKVKWNR